MATCGSCKERGKTVAHVKACYAGPPAAAVVAVEDDNRAEYELAAAEATEAAAWAGWNDNLLELWAEDAAIGVFRAAGFTVEVI